MHGPGVYGECDVWRANSLARIAAEHPALVVVSSNHAQALAPGTLPIEGPLVLPAWRDGASRIITRLEFYGAKVAVVADTPELPFDPVDCLSRNPDHILRCAVSRSSALDLDWYEAEREVAHSLSATFVEFSGMGLCVRPVPAGRWALPCLPRHESPRLALFVGTRFPAGGSTSAVGRRWRSSDDPSLLGGDDRSDAQGQERPVITIGGPPRPRRTAAIQR